MKAYVSTIKNVRMGNGISVNIYELRIFKRDNVKPVGKGRTPPDLYFTRTSGHGVPKWMLDLAYYINSGRRSGREYFDKLESYLTKEEKEDLSRLLGIKGDEHNA